MENKMLIRAYELIRSSEVFFDRTSLEWTRQLYAMYKRGWLYGATHGDDLLAVAGAFRISEWDEKYRHELPENESGNLLYVSFFCSQSQDIMIALKLLRHFLKENPEIKEIVYYKKDWNAGRRRFKLMRPSQHEWATNLTESTFNAEQPRKRLIIEPPELNSVFNVKKSADMPLGAWMAN